MSATITKIPPIDPAYVETITPVAVNDQGVVLLSQPGAETWQAGESAPISLGSYTVSDINDQGQIVGLVNASYPTSYGVIVQNGVSTALPNLTSKQYMEWVSAINDSGVAVGVSTDTDGITKAVYWQNGQIAVLNGLSVADAINNSGQIVGSSGVQAALWDNGVVNDLGLPSSMLDSFAVGINAKGQIIGDGVTSDNQPHAILWQNGTMTQLGALPGETISMANAINDAGIIVGYSEPAALFQNKHAVIWTNGQIVDLNSLLAPNSGWDLQVATAINNNGEIVGTGQYNGAAAAFALFLSGNDTVAGMSVQAALQSGTTTPVTVADSVANVLGSLDSLQSLSQKNLLSAIYFTDAGTPSFTLTASQLVNDPGAVSAMSGNYSVTVQGSIAAAGVYAGHQIAGHLASVVSVSDTAFNVVANADYLENLAADGKLGTISLTDQSVLTISIGQAGNDASALSHIQGSYKFALFGYSMNYGPYLDQLEAWIAAGQVASVTLEPEGGTSVPLTSQQLVTDVHALDALNTMVVLYITPSSANAEISGLAQDANVLVLGGQESQYSITSAGDGSAFTISGPSADNQISGLTAIQFQYQTVFVASQTATVAGAVSSAQVVDLYAAVLARKPDALGLAYYETMAKQNPQMMITDFAKDFLQSSEYNSAPAHTYAQSSAGDAQFVTDTYTNLLHRAPEAGAVAWYQANVINPFLANAAPGTAAYTSAELNAHAAVLADFSQSGEFLGDVTVTAQHPADAQHWLVLI